MSAGFKDVFAMMMGWSNVSSAAIVPVTQQVADEVLRRCPDVADTVLRGAPGVADEVLRRYAEAADAQLTRW